MKFYLLFISMLSLNFLHADEFDLIDEQSTLSYQALQINATQSDSDKNIHDLANQSAYVVFNVYIADIDYAIRKKLPEHKNKIPPAVFMQEVYPFIDPIVNQLDTVAQKLSPSDRQIFWNYVKVELIKTMGKWGKDEGVKTKIYGLIALKQIIG